VRRPDIFGTRGAATLFLGLVALAAPRPGLAQQPVVHAVLFYSPTCPHCHRVLTEDLPPLTKKYGKQLVVAGVDVTGPTGHVLFEAVVAHFGLKPPRYGVPTLVVGSEVMVGDREIPERFPGLIEQGLAAGGVGWPDIPALRAALVSAEAKAADTARSADSSGAAADTVSGGADTVRSAADRVRSATDTVRGAADTTERGPDTAAAPVEAPTESTPAITTDLAPAAAAPGPLALFRTDPVGNGAAVVVLFFLLAALLISVAAAARGKPGPVHIPSWTLPVLATVGMAVASYLAFVEVTGHTAVCGPVGDCNTVQQSPYAVLFGLLPLGILGQIGYLAMFGAWLVAVLGPRGAAPVSWSLLWALALAGTAFSVYLTFLEPFVIGATCVWCLTSAVVMALMLLAATPHAIPGGAMETLS